MVARIERRKTAHLLLRRIVPEDVPALAAITADARTNLHRPGGAPSLLESRQIVRDCIRRWEQDGIGYWVVEHADAVVGIAGVRPFELAHRACWNLYYRFAPAAWGKGLATEAAREAVVVARGQPPARPVVARTRPGNAAAVKVAQAAGLTRRPELDYDGFAVLAAGWPQAAGA